MKMQQTQTKFELFVERLCQRPAPQHPVARMKVIARELAEGAMERIWRPGFDVTNSGYQQGIKVFLERRYSDFNQHFDFPLLVIMGYLTQGSGNSYYITEQAFELLEAAASSKVFVSYKRLESSSFALLIHDRLKVGGLNPFVDMQLRPGDKWHNELRNHIKQSDMLVLLLGRTTLKSKVTLDEVATAIQANVPVIPIWHHGFKLDASQWVDVPSDILDYLGSTHTIRVAEENPLAYDTAIRELMNRLGIVG